MFAAIGNTPRPYAWGAPGAISQLLGWEGSDAPEAELWLGAHPGSPSRILDPAVAGGAADLAEWIAASPATTLGRPGQLPYLLKVLAADAPLSLQAHPHPERARLGFERENALGIPLDAAHRNYRDDQSKPELLYAISESFEALCGFRPVGQTLALARRLAELDDSASMELWLRRLESDDIAAVFGWLIQRGEGVPELVDSVVRIARRHPAEFGVVTDLADRYPGDAGIVIALMLNHVTLRRGEALYLAAGNIHSYLRGTGIELMSASDNVLRGGLTDKHVDTAELSEVLEFEPTAVPRIQERRLGPQHTRFAPHGAGFQLDVVSGDARLDARGAAIALCTSGSFRLTGAQSATTLDRGQAVFSTHDEGALGFEGTGEVFVASGTGAQG